MLKNSEEIHEPLNYSLKGSVEPIVVGQKRQNNEEEVENLVEDEVKIQMDKKNKRKIKLYLGIGSICLILAIGSLILLFIVPGLIVSQIRKRVFDKVVFSPQNEKNWAHFPGDSGTKIIRNYTFFNFTNADQVLLYNQKPKFREIQGFKLLEKEDYLDIKYINDSKRVQFRDWLHFQQFPSESRNLQQKVKIINIAKLGYWYQLKNARPTILLQQGLATTFSNLEASIYNTVLGQGINSQYLNDFTATTKKIFIPSQIEPQNWEFLFYDIAYGLGSKDTVSSWINATIVSKNGQFSSDALFLKDYFTLSDNQMLGILTILAQYIQSIEGLIFQNHYCNDFECTGRNLAINQLSSSYVTRNTPPVSTTQPTQTICQANTTCDGKFPQLSAFYRNIYLKKHPKANSSLSFNPQTILSWFNHNLTKQGYQYNTQPNCLLHIGNLDWLWQNGTQYDQKGDSSFLLNIQNQFGLESEQHTMVFWEWLKYFYEVMVKQQGNNEYVGISTLFSQSIYKSFIAVQNHLQVFLVESVILENTQKMSCEQLFSLSLDSSDPSILNTVCDYFGNNKEVYIPKLIKVCRNKYGYQWKEIKSLGASYINMQSLCDSSISRSFGFFYHTARKYLDTYYQCNETPNPYCSDYQLAVKQWANSTVTRNPIPQIINSYKKTSTISNWFPSLTKPFQYFHYTTLYSNRKFPIISTYVGYILLNFNNWFSSSVVLRQFLQNSISNELKDYIRYTIIFVAMDGFTVQKTAKELMLGYKDQFLQNIRTAYPPFGGDPSVNSTVMFNDPNITDQQALTVYELATGIGNYSDLGQFKKVNNLAYLTINRTKFNGTKIYSVLQSPWAVQDYFYGTNAKFFSPNQDIENYVSIYIPNVQRYKGGSDYQPYERFGIKARIGYGSDEIFQNKYQNAKNEKYYQIYHGIFNETSVTGIPLFMTKNHFLTCPSNWSTFVDIYNEDQTIHYQQTSKWDESFFIYEPYSGISLQTVLFLQANYFYQPDLLFSYQQTSLLPVFSVHRSGNMTQETANKNYGELNSGLYAIVWTFYLFLSVTILSGLTVIFAIYMLCKIRKNQRLKIKEQKLDKNMVISLQRHQDKHAEPKGVYEQINQKE